MLYERKLIKEVINENDVDLILTEYRASVYAEIANYLAENNCNDGMNLVNKSKEEIINFVTTTKNALSEMEDICNEITKLIKNLYIEKQDIPSTIIVENRNIFISNDEDKYAFIYSIGFNEYKKLYIYGIIKAKINKGEFCKIESKIGFSNDSNLERYADFKNYYSSMLNEFNNCKSIKELDFLKKNVNDELLKLFCTDNLKKYLLENNERIYKLTGIEGIKIIQELYQIYDINRIKIKLISNGYSIEENKLIELIRLKNICIKLIKEIEKLDDIEDKDIREICIKNLQKKNKQIEFLMKELNMSSAELEIAIDKVNS